MKSNIEGYLPSGIKAARELAKAGIKPDEPTAEQHAADLVYFSYKPGNGDLQPRRKKKGRVS